MERIDPNEFAKRLKDAFGGADKFLASMEERRNHFNALWARDRDKIGRVVHAHIVVEHFMTLYISSKNPNISNIDNARLTFNQKLLLVGTNDPSVSYLLPGIQRLNEIRNRLAHRLDAEITRGDATVFLSIPLFREMRVALGDVSIDARSPIEILELFARDAAVAFQCAANPESALWGKVWESLSR